MLKENKICNPAIIFLFFCFKLLKDSKFFTFAEK